MTAPLAETTYLAVTADRTPSFDLLGGPDYKGSRALFDRYFDLRDAAQATPDNLSEEELRAIQESSQNWADEAGLLAIPETPEERYSYYTDFSREMAGEKILGLVNFLAKKYGDKIPAIKLEATRAFFEMAFSMYGARPEEGVAPDADGSFAFVVPARMGRNHPDYGKEVEPTIPAFLYLPNKLRAHMMVGLPPFVIDTYEQGGYLVLAPVFEDMAHDLGSSVGLLMKGFTGNVNAAVDFAQQRFGVSTIGLGATLPRYTNYGKTITNKDVVLTTGHAGTTEFIKRIVESSLEGRIPKSIGVLGLGAIGEAIARILAAKYPESKINIFDPKQHRIDRVVGYGPNFVGRAKEAEVIDESDIVVSAATTRFNLEAIGVRNFEGKVIVDDSQPGSFDPAQAEKMGGAVVWAIGADRAGKTARRRGYDYATMVDAHGDLFGCEAEAATIARYRVDLVTRGWNQSAIDKMLDRVAVHDRVTVRNVARMAILFDRFGIGPSEPQAFGRPVTLPAHS